MNLIMKTTIPLGRRTTCDYVASLLAAPISLFPRNSHFATILGPKFVSRLSIVSGVFLFALMAGPSARAVGSVEAVAGTVSVIQQGPLANTASANDGLGRTANTSRTSTSVLGSVANYYRDTYTPMASRTSSDFTVVGLNGTAALTFHWGFSGSRTWDPNNAAFGGRLSVALESSGFNSTLGWGISYVDGPVSEGNFAGVLTNSFNPSGAGGGYVVAFDPADWNGQGTRTATTTMTSAFTGRAGTYYLRSEVDFSGNVTASYGSVLSRVTVEDGSQIAAGAHLQLDNGSQVAITAVPEPSTYALYALCAVFGLVAVGRHARLSRRNKR